MYVATTLQVCIAFALLLSVFGYHHVNYFKGVDAHEMYDNLDEKVLKVKDVAIFFLLISFSACWSITSVTYSSNLKPRIGSARGGPGCATDIASHMRFTVEATTWGLRFIGGTSKG
jgi:hypothetical protein